MGDFTGRVAVVTGANSGIGQAAAVRMAAGGATVVLVGRDRARLDAALQQARAVARPDREPVAHRADFAVLEQVRELATWLRASFPSIGVLANNAGGAMTRRLTTVDGYESTVQVNHLAPFLLANLLRDLLAGGRIINTASVAHRVGRVDPADLNGGAGRFRPFVAYGSSKQASILFAAEAARRWPKVLSFSYHPGVVATRFGRDSRVVATFYRMGPYLPFLRTPEQGADTMLWLARTPEPVLVNGGYYVNRSRREPYPAAADPALAAALWDASLRAVGLTSPR